DARDGRRGAGAAVRERGRPDQGRPAREALHLAGVAQRSGRFPVFVLGSGSSIRGPARGANDAGSTARASKRCARSGTAAAVAAPFTVDSSQKVTNLNADQLDGMDASALAGHAYAEADAYTSTLLSNSTYTTVTSVEVPAGSYVVTFTSTSGDTGSATENYFS